MLLDDPAVVKELFMHLESPPRPAGRAQFSPTASHWASTQNPPNY